MNESIMKDRQQRKRKRLRAYSSVSTILADNESLKLPPVSTRQKTNPERSLSSYQLSDYSYAKVSYRGKKTDKISSKIDFFNAQNQRKLDVSRKNILKSVGAQPLQPKPRPARLKRRHNLTPSLHILVSQYLRKKQQDQQKQCQYLVVGSKNNLVYQ